MAGFTEMSGGNFDQLLQRNVAMPMNRGAAAALTVAFEIRKADYLSRGEKVSDQMVEDEIKEIYIHMMAMTDPATGVAVAQAAAAARAKQH